MGSSALPRKGAPRARERRARFESTKASAGPAVAGQATHRTASGRCNRSVPLLREPRTPWERRRPRRPFASSRRRRRRSRPGGRGRVLWQRSTRFTTPHHAVAWSTTSSVLAGVSTRTSRTRPDQMLINAACGDVAADDRVDRMKRIRGLFVASVFLSSAALAGIARAQATAPSEPRPTAPATDEAPRDAQIAELILNLGDDDPDTRNASSESLLKIGAVARSPLMAALRSPFPENPRPSRRAAPRPPLGCPGRSAGGANAPQGVRPGDAHRQAADHPPAACGDAQ